MGSHAAESNGRSEHTEALYREHGAAVAALCRSLLRDRPEAEDATQQVFLSAHRALLNGTVPREPLAWLLAVARNECYARFRRHATTPLPAAEAPDGRGADASVHVLRADELASMWDEVERMPPAQREAFLLREIRGLSYRQLAAELSLSPPSVRSLLLRARTRLRHRLRDAVAAFGGASWVQPLLRIVSSGDGSSPVPAATKAVAVGLGTLALAGGGSLARVEHRSTPPHRHATPRPRTHGRVGHLAATPAALAVEPRRGRPVLGHDSGGSGSRTGRSHDSGDSSGSGSGGISGSGDGPSGATTTTVSDGGGEISSGSGPSGSDGSGDATTTTFTQTTSSDGGDGGSSGPSSGSSSGSDGGSGSVTTATTTTSSGSGSGSDGHGGGSDGG